MTEVLLEQLTNEDIQWLRKTGQTLQVNANSVLIEANKQVDFFYLILSGELVARVSRNTKSALGKAFAALEGDRDLEQEIGRFSGGEVLGEIALFNINSSASTVQAIENSVVLALPRQEMMRKLEQDAGFASRFYKSIAFLLKERFQRLLKLYLSRKMGQISPLQVGQLFGELSDSDVDWMLSGGHLEEISRDTVVISAGKQVENLYVLLQGKMSVRVSEAQKNRLTVAFAALEQNQDLNATPEREIARASRGEIVGEITAFDMHLSNYTLKALEDSLVLAIPRQKLLGKLQQDTRMAARFYRMIGLLISSKHQGLIDRLGFGRSSYKVGQSLSEDVNYEDEIDLEVIDNISLGRARFDWMLKRLNVS